MLAKGVRGRPDVAAIASRDENKLCVLVWHYHDDDLPGPVADIALTIEDAGISNEWPKLRQFQIDADHRNAYTQWQKMGSPQSPTPEQYAKLEQSGQLAEINLPKLSTAADGRTTVNFSLPRQGVTLLEFSLSNSGSANP